MKMITSERHEAQESPAVEAREHKSGRELSKRVRVGGKRVLTPRGKMVSRSCGGR
jgi:hypothetical protein